MKKKNCLKYFFVVLLICTLFMTGGCSALSGGSISSGSSSAASGTSAAASSTVSRSSTASGNSTASGYTEASGHSTTSGSAAASGNSTVSGSRAKSSSGSGSTTQAFGASGSTSTDDEEVLDEDGSYYSKEDVSLYLHTWHHLPDNYITKKEARALGWEGGPVEPYAPGKAIGGDTFGNYEGNLPEDHTYHECDIDTEGKSRGAKRLVWSDDWSIYYTEDHYETFELLYTEDDK